MEDDDALDDYTLGVEICPLCHDVDCEELNCDGDYDAVEDQE